MTKTYNRLSLGSFLLLLVKKVFFPIRTNRNNSLTLRIFLLITLTCFATLANSQNLPVSPIFTDEVTSESTNGWMKFKPETTINPNDFINRLTAGNTKNNFSYSLIDKRTNALAKTRHVYQQHYQNIPVHNHLVLLHEENKRIFLAQNSSFVSVGKRINPVPNMSPKVAINQALNIARAETYAWEVPALEQDLKDQKGNPAATYYPTTNLVWMVGDQQNISLTYTVDVFSVSPLASKRYFINAQSGQLMRTTDLLYTGCFDTNHAEHTCTANTTNEHFKRKELARENSNNLLAVASGIANYVNTNGGVVTDVATQLNGSNYILKTSTLGPTGTQIIETISANNEWNYNNLTNVEDADNFWEADSVAFGAHWAAQLTYQYFLDTFGRNSFDNAGTKVESVVHYGTDYGNAYWLSGRMTFGDGDGTFYKAFTSLDIVAHEFTHGVVEYNGTGGLIYANESGALNESFADIFGAVVEFLYHPDGGEWLIGEDFDNFNALRNMENPHAKGYPNTYLGTYWEDGTIDNGGVHINSSVPNYWFYLLSEGGSGTNDFGYNYDVDSIGMQKAAAIAYYNLTNYLTPNASFKDAKEGAINSTKVLFPGDVDILAAVEEAWCAVGLGLGCGPTIQVDEPVLNEVVTAGRPYTIEWTSSQSSPTSKVRIEYTTEDKPYPKWQLIAENVANTGTYDWTVEATYTTTARVRVTDDGDPSKGRNGNSDILGISDFFQIEACLSANSFSIPSTVLVNEPVQFNGNVSGDTYEWQIDGQQVATSSNYSHTFSDQGIYHITYTVNSSAAGCFNTETKRISVLGPNSHGFAMQVGELINNTHRASSQEILQTADGGYIFATLFTSLVFKIDKDGVLQWQSLTLPRPPDGNYRLKAIETGDGNILAIMANSASNGASSDDDLLIFELDGTTGTVLNSSAERYGLTGKLAPHQIVATDTSYIIGGEYVDGTKQELFLLEIKATDFSIVKQTWFGDENVIDYYGQLIATSEGGYLFSWGQADYWHFAIAKLDENFQTEWSQAITSTTVQADYRTRIRMIELPSCEGYMFMAGANHVWNSALVKLNAIGNIQWAKRFEADGGLEFNYLAMHDMVWDGGNGITLWGINVTNLTDNLLVESIDYQLFNVDYDGQIRWTSKIDGLDTKIPATPYYHLYVTELLLTADGGYMTALPVRAGDESYLIKMDSLGIDGCLMDKSGLTSEDATSLLSIEPNITITLPNNPTITVLSDYSLTAANTAMTVETPDCGVITGGNVNAAFRAEDFTMFVNEAPVIHNMSTGATNYIWKLDGTTTSLPLTGFTTAGVYELTLEASDGVNSSITSHNFHVVDSTDCALPCDLTVQTAYASPPTCPGAADGSVYSVVVSPSGRNFSYNLYDDQGNLLESKSNSGYFPGLPAGDYQLIVNAINDVTCSLDLGMFTVEPKIDETPPVAVCLSDAVDAAFVHAASGTPSNLSSYIIEMNTVFGGNWHEFVYETLEPTKLFSDFYNVVYLEGTTDNADELEAFLDNNQSLIEDWVAAGNALFLNAGPTEGNGMDFGFGGVQLVVSSYDDAVAVDNTLAIFNGPETPISDSYSGYPYSRGAVVCPPGLDTTRMLQSPNGTDLLVEASWGNGRVLFGGMNATGFHYNNAVAINFRENILHYLKGLPIATVNTPITIALDENQSYNLNVSEIDLGSFDACSIIISEIDNANFDCENVGIQEVVLTITDASNNEATCTTQIKITGEIELPTDIAICQGATYDFRGNSYSEAGVYRDTLITPNACDSIFRLNLTILDTFHMELTESICQGDSLLFDGNYLKTAGTYQSDLTAENGCDSTVVLALSVKDTFYTQLTESICQGDSLLFDGNYLKTAGTYQLDLTTENGCDSTVVLALSVKDTFYTQLTESICQGDSLLFDGNYIKTSGTYKTDLMAINGCDSTVVLALSISPTSLTELSANICQGDGYDFNGEMLTDGGTYLDTLTNAHNCDSIIALDLIVSECFGCLEDTLRLLNGPIEAGHYKASMAIVSDTTLMEDIITFQAGENISLNPGFCAKAGTEFHAFIDPMTCEEEAFNSKIGVEQRVSSYKLDSELIIDLQVNPNPFYQQTKIEFSIDKGQKVKLDIYSIEGQLIEKLQEGYLPAGNHTQWFDINNHSGNLFLVVLQTEITKVNKKIICMAK